MTTNINRDIYNRQYSDENVRLQPANAYDRWMVDFRFSLIDEYGCGKDVLDLCCGTGSYLIPKLRQIKLAIGVDFSSTMLNGFKKNLHGVVPPNLTLVEGDAAAIPVADESVDFVFSYTALYYVDNIAAAIKEVARVLRRGGYAALELGNLNSVNTIVCKYQHKHNGWAKPFYIPYAQMLRCLRDAGLEVVRRHSFQLLNTYGAPRRLFFLYPLVSPLWKRILGIEVRRRMLDEWISGSWPLRYLSFRHTFVCQRSARAT